MTTYHQTLLAKINARQATVAVIGRGYDGLSLAVELAQAGFRTLVLDPDRGRVEALNVGRSYHPAVPSVAILTGLKTGKLSAHPAAEVHRLRQCDAIALCLPAPRLQSGDPDPAALALAAAVETIGDYLHPGLLLLLTGSAPLDFVQESLRPHLVRSRLALGRELFVACWPEGLEAGRLPQPRARPKGLTAACTELATAWYNLIAPAAGVPHRSPAARAGSFLAGSG